MLAEAFVADPTKRTPDASLLQEQATQAEEGKELVREVWEVIALKYADIRGGGFDQARWAQLRDEALQKPLRDEAATYR